MTIRPWRSSLMPSSVVAMGISRISFERANGEKDLTRYLEKFLYVFSDQIGFHIDFITNPADAQISVPQSEWDNCHGKAPAAAFVHGQADAVYSNGSLGDEQGSQLRRHTKREKGKFPSGLDRFYAADAIDVTGDPMAAQSILQPQRAFKINQAPSSKYRQARALERFGGYVHRKAALAFFYQRQTRAVDGDARPKFHGTQTETSLYA